MQNDRSARARPDGAAAEQDRRGPAPEGLAEAIGRVARVLDLETAALRERRTVDVEELNSRKSQGLLELSRIGRRLDRAALDPATLEMLRDLRDRLERNRSVLRLHLEAVQEISDVLSEAIRNEDSDGTYSIRGSGG